MLWIEAHKSLYKSPKIARLMTLLGVSRNEAVGTVIALWFYAAEHHPDGDLSAVSDEEIGRAIGRKTRPASRLIAILAEAGFLDPDRRIHDWASYSGRRHRYAESNKNRMREKRKKRGGEGELCGTRVKHVRNTPPSSLSASSLPPFLPPTPPIISLNLTPPITPPSHLLSSSLFTARTREGEAASWLAAKAATLGKKYWGRELTTFEVESIMEIVATHARRRIGLRNPIPPLTEEDAELLAVALEASALAGKCQINYLAGVYITFGKNKIFTEGDYWEHQIERTEPYEL